MAHRCSSERYIATFADVKTDYRLHDIESTKKYAVNEVDEMECHQPALRATPLSAWTPTRFEGVVSAGAEA